MKNKNYKYWVQHNYFGRIKNINCFDIYKGGTDEIRERVFFIYNKNKCYMFYRFYLYIFFLMVFLQQETR